jgi:tetratricopeptide (TPR) repeat protein
LEQQISVEISTGSDDLRKSRYVEAESWYRSALKLNEEIGASSAQHGWHTDHSSSEILVGLAVALAGQHRSTEAEQLYKRIILSIEPDQSALVEVLEHYAALERRMGNSARLNDLLVQAKAIRKGDSARTPGL